MLQFGTEKVEGTYSKQWRKIYRETKKSGKRIDAWNRGADKLERRKYRETKKLEKQRNWGRELMLRTGKLANKKKKQKKQRNLGGE